MGNRVPCSVWAPIVKSCAATLRTLKITDLYAFSGVMQAGDFRVLRKVDVHGKGASRFFATIAMGCASTLEDLKIRDSHEFAEAMPGDFRVLQSLSFEGNGADRCRMTVPQHCVQHRH
eukprot:GHVU01084128.1.p1 GENE.GHVU01084128.1~~GHVU01084128.1.p1  ORF type:complete len:132 (+),score=15.10 GHVU01084128.1:45-398(+)